MVTSSHIFRRVYRSKNFENSRAAFDGIHRIPTEGWPGRVNLGGWLHTEMVYPSVMVGHPSK